jgi:hypothetical protein
MCTQCAVLLVYVQYSLISLYTFLLFLASAYYFLCNPWLLIWVTDWRNMSKVMAVKISVTKKTQSHNSHNYNLTLSTLHYSPILIQNSWRISRCKMVVVSTFFNIYLIPRTFVSILWSYLISRRCMNKLHFRILSCICTNVLSKFLFSTLITIVHIIFGDRSMWVSTWQMNCSSDTLYLSDIGKIIFQYISTRAISRFQKSLQFRYERIIVQ